MGTTMVLERGGLRFAYLPGQWENEADFEEFKAISFREFRNEVIQLLYQVEMTADRREVPEAWKVYAR
ncbi:hypothetical protein [Paenibacillus sp.]|uniref:hypothetical protein n=1 Tax=Paenibacillus sp. TaxID=58172 RepID=UPI002D6F8C0D|nr:hypothetical protein [Paenibacillus sp.]HZG83860.1 hypothetical protein [Paenibacillus sp.]